MADISPDPGVRWSIKSCVFAVAIGCKGETLGLACGLGCIQLDRYRKALLPEVLNLTLTVVGFQCGRGDSSVSYILIRYRMRGRSSREPWNVAGVGRRVFASSSGKLELFPSVGYCSMGIMSGNPCCQN